MHFPVKLAMESNALVTVSKRAKTIGKKSQNVLKSPNIINRAQVFYCVS